MNNFIKAKQSASIKINQKIHELKKGKKQQSYLWEKLFSNYQTLVLKSF